MATRTPNNATAAGAGPTAARAQLAAARQASDGTRHSPGSPVPGATSAPFSLDLPFINEDGTVSGANQESGDWLFEPLHNQDLGELDLSLLGESPTPEEPNASPAAGQAEECCDTLGLMRGGAHRHNVSQIITHVADDPQLATRVLQFLRTHMPLVAPGVPATQQGSRSDIGGGRSAGAGDTGVAAGAGSPVVRPAATSREARTPPPCAACGLHNQVTKVHGSGEYICKSECVSVPARVCVSVTEHGVSVCVWYTRCIVMESSHSAVRVSPRCCGLDTWPVPAFTYESATIRADACHRIFRELVRHVEQRFGLSPEQVIETCRHVCGNRFGNTARMLYRHLGNGSVAPEEEDVKRRRLDGVGRSMSKRVARIVAHLQKSVDAAAAPVRMGVVAMGCSPPGAEDAVSACPAGHDTWYEAPTVTLWRLGQDQRWRREGTLDLVRYCACIAGPQWEQRCHAPALICTPSSNCALKGLPVVYVGAG